MTTQTQNASRYQEYLEDLSTLPVSFVYQDEAFRGFPAAEFRPVDHRQTGTPQKTTDVFVLRRMDLQVTVEATLYPAYGGYEWTVWFENVGTLNSGVIRDLRVADLVLAGERPVLKGILGDHQNQYQPYEQDLRKKSVQFRSDKGRPTHIYFPYFNLEHGDGGTLMAIGWGGTWEARFTAETPEQTRFIGSGTNNLCTYLKPG